LAVSSFRGDCEKVPRFDDGRLGIMDEYVVPPGPAASKLRGTLLLSKAQPWL
jgi:hypothetical protein